MELEKFYCCNCTCEEFDNEYEIRKHYRISHKGFNEKCNICFNQFRRVDDLKEHKDEEHGIRNLIVKTVCVHCNNRVFKYSFGLNSHSKWAHPNYSVKCTKCANFFPSEIDQDEHMRKFHGNSEFCKDGAGQASP